MKRFLKYIIIAVIIVSTAFGVYKITSEYRVSVISENIECNIILKGVEKSKSMTTLNNNVYIAFENLVVEINNNGKERLIIKDKELDIEEIEGVNGELIILSKDKLYKVDLNGGNLEEIISMIPNEGKRLNRKLLAVGEDLYISISSVTNSGVATYEDGAFDKAPYDITLGEGTNGKIGAFKPYDEESKPLDVIKGNKIGNTAIYKVNVKNKKIKLFASGIKNITGMDFNSKNESYMIVQGMLPDGERPVYRDKDYIYKLNSGLDYGFPDYSGGDPITSPRFIKENEIKNLLQNSNGKNVPSPIFQYKSVGTLNYLAIDREGNVFEKDSKIFYDNDEKVIGTLNNKGVYSKVLKLNQNANVKEIKYSDKRVLVLDSEVGILYELRAKGSFVGFKLSPIVWIVIISVSIVLLVVVVLKFLKKK